MQVKVLILPSAGSNTVEAELYEQLLQQFCTWLTQRGFDASVVDNLTDRSEIEPRRCLQITAEKKNKLRVPLRGLPGVYRVMDGGRGKINLHVYGHTPKTLSGKTLLWVADHLDNVMSASVLDDRRLLIYFTDGSSVVLNVDDASRQP